MLKTELIPDLEHCIETVARRKHAELSKRLLERVVGDTEAEEKLEALRLFLGTADFRKLRAESEKHLVKGKGVRFTVYLESGMPKCEMQITQVSQQGRSYVPR